MFSNDSMLDALFGGKFFQDIASTLDYNGSEYWGLISGTFNNVILPVGYALLCLYFLIELLGKTTQENFNIEQFFKLFIKLLIGKLLMDNCITLLDGMSAFAGSITNGIANNSGTSSLVNIDALKGDSLGFWKTIQLWLKLIIPYIAILAAGMFAKITIFSRAIEIITRTMMAPIGMSDMFSEGMRGSGFRYLKKFLAVNLQGAIILVIVVAMSYFNTNSVRESIVGRRDEYLAEMDDFEPENEEERRALAVAREYWEGVNADEQIIIQDPEEIPGDIAITSILSAFVTVTLMQRSKEIAGDLVGV